MRKDKAKKIELTYRFSRELDDVLAIGIKLKEAKDSVLSLYGENIECNVGLCNVGKSIWFGVSIKEKLHGINIDGAASEFLSLAGLPEKVYSNYGFDRIEKSLPSGIKLYPKSLLGKIFGTYVVSSE